MRKRWQWIGAFTAMAAAVVTLFMFLTGFQSVPELLRFWRHKPTNVDADTGTPAGEPHTPNSSPARHQQARALPPPQALDLEDERGRRYPVEVALEAIVRRESDTLVRLALTYQGSDPAQYLLHAFREGHDRVGARDEFYLTDASGARHAWTGQQGAIESRRAREVGTLCVPLPRNVRQTFDLIFPAAVPEGPVTLLHTRAPRIFGYIDCPAGTTVTLPDFAIRHPAPAP